MSAGSKTDKIIIPDRYEAKHMYKHMHLTLASSRLRNMIIPLAQRAQNVVTIRFNLDAASWRCINVMFSLGYNY